ncbi:MAG: hypothetical protein WCK11_01710, partial [Candidatus Falkowbacteria bacterium]
LYIMSAAAAPQETNHATMIIIHVDDNSREMSYLIGNESIFLKEVPDDQFKPDGITKRDPRHPDEFISLVINIEGTTKTIPASNELFCLSGISTMILLIFCAGKIIS